jgi:dTDP-4-dehydrorhamnose reductase
MAHILILGGNSFIAKSISPYLTKNHNVYSPTHKQVDATNQLQLNDLFHQNKYDVVINCAVKGGRRTHKDTPQDLCDNLLILNNILYFQQRDKFKFIVFSSGAEYDRRGNIFDVKEDKVFLPPTDYYGLSKYIQTNLVRGKDNIINLKLFNVFGEMGMEDSFIGTCVNKCLKNEDIEIWEDKIFTTFYAEDLEILIENLILENNKQYLELNCGYKDLDSLYGLAKLIKALTFSKSNIIIKQDGKAYFADCTKLAKRNYKFYGLTNALKKYIRYIQTKK